MSHDDIAEHAREFLRRFGEAAGLQAAMRADSCMDRQDIDGHRLWLAVLDQIERLELDSRGSTLQ